MVMACDNFEDVNEESQFSGDLILGKWNLDFGTYQSVDVTELLNDYPSEEILKLTFNDQGTWTSANGEDLFESNGDWSISSSNANLLLMGATAIDVNFNFDGTILNMSFDTNNELVGARGEGLIGRYELSFSKIE